MVGDIQPKRPHRTAPAPSRTVIIPKRSLDQGPTIAKPDISTAGKSPTALKSMFSVKKTVQRLFSRFKRLRKKHKIIVCVLLVLLVSAALFSVSRSQNSALSGA